MTTHPLQSTGDRGGDAAESGPQRGAPGFTLVELLTVIAIVGLLAALLIPTMGGARNSARRAETRIRFSQWANALEQFRQDYGYYPAVTTDGLLNPSAFLGALTARDHLGAPVPDDRLAGNTRRALFHSVAEAEFVKDAGGAAVNELVDAFGNSDIVILVDVDGNGVIQGAELVRRPVRPGNSHAGYGAALTPAAEDFPAAGIRAGVILYSAGPGGGADFVYSWK
jgi:prepilin-type N-terminal cleavage/methylation domain-containing protein